MRCSALVLAALLTAGAAPLRVCANSDNYPASTQAGTGFENKLAEFVAAKLHRPLAYTWWPARENFLARTLNSGRCDVVMGVPVGLDEVDTTEPYYRSGYVLLSRPDTHLTSLRDARLKTMKIGVYLIGDDQTPPALALSREGLSDNVHGYMTFFDRNETSSGLVTALQHGELDVAAVWGPLVGTYARHQRFAVAPIRDTGFAPLVFQYDIAMGVRHGDDALRHQLDTVIGENRAAIKRILTGYGVPLLAEGGQP